MKRIALLLLSVVAFGAVSFAEGKYSGILDEFRKYRVSFNYSYTIPGLQDVVTGGSAVVQGNCFRMEGEGMLILCDGDNIWTLDMDSREAYVESAGEMDYSDYISSLEWEGDTLTGSFVEPASGSILSFTLYNIEKKPLSGNLSVFSPSEDSFEGDWIITDLR